MEQKACIKCHVAQPLSEFYRHSKMRDGHLNKCKACTRIEVNANRAAKLAYYQAYDRVRYAHQGRRGVPSAETQRRGSRAWSLRNREKTRAQSVLARAVRTGKLLVPKRCSACRTKGAALQAHHADYDKPLDVQWLCVKCHATTHRRSDVRADLALLAQGPKSLA